MAFRNEAQLPLRLGLVIDTSNSVTERFRFEQAAAAKFLKSVMTDKDDLAFVVGVNNSVLAVQDFTADQAQRERAIEQLAPGGGTALWDAVGFAAEKLSARAESGAVARMIVVISDGEDNSSVGSLKDAIGKRAQAGEVSVYTITTREAADKDAGGSSGESRDEDAFVVDGWDGVRAGVGAWLERESRGIAAGDTGEVFGFVSAGGVSDERCVSRGGYQGGEGRAEADGVCEEGLLRFGWSSWTSTETER